MMSTQNASRQEVLSNGPSRGAGLGNSSHRVSLELLDCQLGKVDEEMVHLSSEGALTDVTHAERPITAAA